MSYSLPHSLCLRHRPSALSRAQVQHGQAGKGAAVFHVIRNGRPFLLFRKSQDPFERGVA